jgi:hypothetical protein
MRSCPQSKIRYSILALLFISLAGNAEYEVIGNAYDHVSGQHLYSEYHSCKSDNLECLVDYRDSSGQLIASKKLNYSTGLTQPALIMKDYRTGIATSIGSQHREGLVVDAGFDNFVRGQWNVLTIGDTVKFPFLVAGFDEPLKMRANLDRSRSCIDEELCLEISLDSWILGFLAEPINLVYSRENRRLLRYQGLSNIRGDSSESLIVDIHYDYEQLVPLTGSAAQQHNPRHSF